VVGALNLFSTDPARWRRRHQGRPGNGDIATIGILQERSIEMLTPSRRQLEVALESRVVIEQAKASWPNEPISASTTRSSRSEVLRGAHNRCE